jgi:alpha-mannosidase
MGTETKDAQNITVHMIGQGHIDPVWLWRIDEGRKEVLDTCASALERMDEDPDFIFTRSSAASYLWVEEDDPAMFEKIRERIAEGRWEIVNGWWEQPDCNIPGGESYVRHAIYAKEYFQEKFGVEPTVGYNPDTFGHHGNLPQILAKSGFESYVFFRPSEQEFREYESETKELPQVFWWEAPDGSRVLACRPPYHYYGFGSDFNEMIDRIKVAKDLTIEGLNDVLCFYGVGNHGGGPTKENMKGIAEYNKQVEDGSVAKYSTCHAFFAKMREDDPGFPVLRDDLQIHAPGCYSVVSAVKKYNRRCEQVLMASERWAALASSLHGAAYPKTEIRDAWRDVLFNQFHDILAGTSLSSAYEDVYAMYEKALEAADSAQSQALRAIARNVDTRNTELNQGMTALVFNPNPWQRQDVVTVEAVCATAPRMVLVTDEDGNELHTQLLPIDKRGDSSVAQIMFNADVPPLGYKLYRLRLDEMRDNYDTKLTPAPLCYGPDTLSNDLLSLRINPRTGAIVSLKLTDGPELIGENGVSFAVMNDPSDTWGHDVDQYRDEIGRFYANGDVRLVEEGPARATVEITGTYGKSSIVQRISVYPGIARVDVECEIDFQEPHRMLKHCVPTMATDGVPTYEIPYSYIERAPNGDEDPGQKWIDMTGDVGGGVVGGVSVINDGRYGFDAKDGEFRTSVLRTAIYAFHCRRQVLGKEQYHYADLGKSTYRYSLVPHAGDWRTAAVPRIAEECNTPMTAFTEPHHNGVHPREGRGFVEIGPQNVVGTVVKMAQSDDRIIVRMYESEGKDGTTATINMPGHGISAQVPISHHELLTLAFDPMRPKAAPVEVDLLERPMEG